MKNLPGSGEKPVQRPWGRREYGKNKGLKDGWYVWGRESKGTHDPRKGCHLEVKRLCLYSKCSGKPVKGNLSSLACV